jgi:hypothetical protein
MKHVPRPVKRFDIYLPTRFNDGRKVPGRLLDGVEDELFERFGGVTVIPRQFALHGLYRGAERAYRDQVVIFTVFDFETAEPMRFMEEYKRVLEGRFKQELVLIAMQELMVF